MKKALIIDFEDSFTFNVIQELEELGICVTLINWKDFEELPSEGMLVLGPGPGHPDDYQRIFPLINNWLLEQKPFLGICLGHQIFWRLQGEDILRSKNPLHGQRVELRLSPSWKEWLEVKKYPFVQRYNSLAVIGQVADRYPHLMNYIQDDEILITKGKRLITYQFHPESIGTSFRRSFFAAALRDLCIIK